VTQLDPHPRPSAPTDAPGRPRLSVIVPVRDELPRLPAVLAMIEGQTLEPDEVVVADGRSTDGTRAWLAAAALTRPWLRIVDNPAQHVPAALNVALAASTGDVVARMDAHAVYARDYLAQVVGRLAAQPEVVGVGGMMATEGRGAWGRAIAATLSRPFGLGGAAHRVGGGGGPVPHVFSGCYRRDALVAAGGWDERLRANEDFEAEVRLRAAGGQLWLEPAATSTWYVRESLPRLAEQMWRYGWYKALTVWLHPASLLPRQTVAPALVAGLVIATAVRPPAGVALSAAYLTAAGALGARAARADGASALRGALVPAVVHLAWGAGALAGAVAHPVRGRTRGGAVRPQR